MYIYFLIDINIYRKIFGFINKKNCLSIFRISDKIFNETYLKKYQKNGNFFLKTIMNW